MPRPPLPPFTAETAALRDFSPAYVCSGSLAPHRQTTSDDGMSALLRKRTISRPSQPVCFVPISNIEEKSSPTPSTHSRLTAPPLLYRRVVTLARVGEILV